MLPRYLVAVTVIRIFAKIEPGNVAVTGGRLTEMPKNPPAPRQVPIRLPDELIRVLEVARLAHGAKSMQAFLSDLVGKAAEGFADEPEIKAMLQNIEEYQARRDGRLKRIDRVQKKVRARRE
jgi:hypothetical protein